MMIKNAMFMTKNALCILILIDIRVGVEALTRELQTCSFVHVLSNEQMHDLT